VVGLSPQVVTETLYALAVTGDPAFVPTEIHLLATRDGAERARLSLLHPHTGWFPRLCREYNLSNIAFPETAVHVLSDEKGEPIDDLRTPHDNERLADTLVELVRGFTDDDSSALHVSIAGGRKTMGFYAGYVLSLFGRAQDRLSHVLISPPYEFNQEFFYPSSVSRIIHAPGGRPLDAQQGQVILADIPFVRLRHHLPAALGKHRMRFTDAIASVSQRLAPPELHLDLEHSRIRIHGVEAQLPPLQMAYLCWFAWRRLKGLPPLPCPNEGSPEPAYAAEFLNVYAAVLGPFGDLKLTRKRLNGGMDTAFFLQTKSKLWRALREAGIPEPEHLLTPQGRRRLPVALQLPPQSIHWIGRASKEAADAVSQS
jgi:CRISPR-associated protein (TIGR02584 family)